MCFWGVNLCRGTVVIFLICTYDTHVLMILKTSVLSLGVVCFYSLLVFEVTTLTNDFFFLFHPEFLGNLSAAFLVSTL